MSRTLRTLARTTVGAGGQPFPWLDGVEHRLDRANGIRIMSPRQVKGHRTTGVPDRLPVAALVSARADGARPWCATCATTAAKFWTVARGESVG